jgi:F-type H+-transporting ATPase subunit gamma
MKRAVAIKRDLMEISTIQDLTSVFESIASIRISKIKNRVLTSKQFFSELWQIYTQLRIDPRDRITSGERHSEGAAHSKAYIVITSEGGLTGDIDERIVSEVIRDCDHATTDLIVVGDHGIKLFNQHGVPVKLFFRTPESSSYIDVSPMIDAVVDYEQITAYYETYVSLSIQKTAHIDLIAAVRSMSDEVDTLEEGTISSRDYVFEPSLPDIIKYMEKTMLSLALSQVILESKLAQDASRFNAMNAAKEKAKELVGDYRLMFNRARRAESDGRLKEIIVSMNNSGGA